MSQSTSQSDFPRERVFVAQFRAAAAIRSRDFLRSLQEMARTATEDAEVIGNLETALGGRRYWNALSA
jgi:hypothetical protein